MLNVGRHHNNMVAVKKELENAYKEASTREEKQRIVWKLSAHKLIKADDPRVRTLGKYTRNTRDLRAKLPFIPKCIYFEYPETIEFKVTIQPHPGTRSYKETTWYVNYPSSETTMRLVDVATVNSYKDFTQRIRQLDATYGYGWKPILDENFDKMVVRGYWAIYRMDLKKITGVSYDDCGYIFMGKNGRGETYKMAFMDKKLMERLNVIPEDVEAKAMQAIEEGLIREKSRLAQAEQARQEKAEAARQKALKEEADRQAQEEALKIEQYGSAAEAAALLSALQGNA